MLEERERSFSSEFEISRASAQQTVPSDNGID
jgi:hypothetical protein